MSDFKITDGDDTFEFQLDAALAREAALREELAKYKDGFFQKVTDEDLKKISDFVGDGDLATNSFFMRADAGNLANMTMHMVREVQSLRIGLTAAEQRNAKLEQVLRDIRQSCELSQLRDAQIDQLLHKPSAPCMTPGCLEAAAKGWTHCEDHKCYMLREPGAKPTESGASERCHEIPGTSGQRLNRLANEGE